MELEEGSSAIAITTSAFFREGIGANAAWAGLPNMTPSIQIWEVGTDVVSDTPPDFVLERVILHALLLAASSIKKVPNAPQAVFIKRGTWKS